VQFLTPGLFDVLVVITIVIAVFAAGLRVYHDFRRGPRWSSPPSQPPGTQPDQPDQQEKPDD
jgi:hypothetical protein